jgi:hypothetical protein
MSSRPTLPRWQFIDANGTPIAGAKLYFYTTGTSTPKATYSDAGLTVPNTNPVIADSAGRTGEIFFASGDYKVILRDAADSLIWTADPVQGGLTVSPFMETVLDDLTAADARTTLGLSYASAAAVETGTSADSIVSPRRLMEWVGNRGQRSGLQVIVNAGDPSNDVDFAEGVACSDAAPWRLIYNSATITKRLDASWVVGTTNGGLFTGSKAADTAYYLWIIRRSDTGVVDAGFDPSQTAPTMHSGSDQKALIGMAYTDASSNILCVLPIGAGEFLSAPQAMTANGSLTLTHGLSIRPANISFSMLCITAQATWVAGDIRQSESGLLWGGAAHAGWDSYATTSVVNVRFHVTNVGLLVDRSSGGAVFATPANWLLIVRARA